MDLAQYIAQFKKRQKFSTAVSIAAIATAAICTVPLFDVNTKHFAIRYCVTSEKGNCLKEYEGVDYLVTREFKNPTFRNNTKFLERVTPDNPNAFYLSLIGALAMIGGTSLSMQITKDKRIALHKVLSQLRIDTINTETSATMEQVLHERSVKSNAEVAKKIMDNHTAEALQNLVSPAEMQYEILQAQKQAEIDVGLHGLNKVEIGLETAKKELEILKINKQKQELSEEGQKNLLDAKESILQALKEHEDGWLFKVIMKIKKPLWLIGNQGSGKTTTAATITYIRQQCMDAPISQLVDRHALGENMDTWKYLNPESIVSTEADIKSALVSAKERWLQRIKERPESYTQTLVDEYTHLINLLDVSLEKGETNPAKEFFLLSLSDTRKAKDLLIGITHNETNETFGKNTFEMRKKGMIMIERFSANNENPLSRTIIKYGLLDEKGNNLFDVERTFPEWFTAKKVYEHFNGTPIDF